MAGDYSRFTFDPRRNYSGVLQQQGRVSLDSDWNEQSEIAGRNFRAAVVDVLGRVFVATPDAFKIEFDSHGRLTIGRGRIFVDGLLAENHGAGRFVWDAVLDEQHGAQPVAYTKQPYLPAAPALPASGGPYQIYLDVWQREVTSVEDPGLADPALGGADTATRLQTVWQVRLASAQALAKDCRFRPPAARLSTDGAARGPQDAAGGYLRSENQLYRVEIHNAGEAGAASFKWSRNNASTVARVIRVIDPMQIAFKAGVDYDAMSGFSDGCLVEVTDDARELDGLPGELRRIKTIDLASSTLSLDAPLSPGLFPVGPNGVPDPARHMRVARWDGSETIQQLGNQIALEDGIAVRLDAEPADGYFRTGDYWLIPARSNDASIGALDRAPPRGIHHHVAKLALFTPPHQLRDCREGVRRRVVRAR